MSLYVNIAVQILEFSISFEAEPRAVKNILFNALHEQPGRARKMRSLRDFSQLQMRPEKHQFLQLPFSPTDKRNQALARTAS